MDSKKRNREDMVRFRTFAEFKAVLEEAAVQDGRSLANWMEQYAVPLAQRQLKKKAGED